MITYKIKRTYENGEQLENFITLDYIEQVGILRDLCIDSFDEEKERITSDFDDLVGLLGDFKDRYSNISYEKELYEFFEILCGVGDAIEGVGCFLSCEEVNNGRHTDETEYVLNILQNKAFFYLRELMKIFNTELYFAGHIEETEIPDPDPSTVNIPDPPTDDIPF